MSMKVSPLRLIIILDRLYKTNIVVGRSKNNNDIDPTTGDKKKPDIITFYNQTKYGLDQMYSLYDVTRNSHRGPFTIFFNLLNIYGINALNVYSTNKVILK